MKHENKVYQLIAFPPISDVRVSLSVFITAPKLTTRISEVSFCSVVEMQQVQLFRKPPTESYRDILEKVPVALSIYRNLDPEFSRFIATRE